MITIGLLAVAPFGVGQVSVPEPVNLFMSVPVTADGVLVIEPSKARPGDEVVLEAVRDVLLVVSACPQDLVLISGADGSSGKWTYTPTDMPACQPGRGSSTQER